MPDELTVACVLRASPDFQPKHVRALRAQCERHLPQMREFLCYSDTFVGGVNTIPLRDPKLGAWWAKMEINADRALHGPVLVLDIDTVLIREFRMVPEHLESSWVMRHPTRYSETDAFACGMMLLTEKMRRAVSKHFTHDHMKRYANDDQRYYYAHWSPYLHRFQDEYPDALAFYKLHVLQHGIREDNAIIHFHGKPRPWETSHDWLPDYESFRREP